jgi:MFS family permease
LSSGDSVVAPDKSQARARLFLVSSLALTMAGIGAAVRANTAADLQRMFLDPIDAARSAEMIATILGLPFLGFAFTIAIGSPLLDVVGMAPLLPLAALCFAAGAAIMIFAGSLASGTEVFTVLWVGALVTGIGWGLVETVINPFTAALYPQDKAVKLDVLHAWWPGGLIGACAVAATIWGTSVCYMWPTMLGTASERFPRGGAFLMGLMGTAGTLSIQFVLPMMGAIYDAKKIEAARGPVGLRRADARSGARQHSRHRGASVVPRRCRAAGSSSWRLRRHLALRPLERRLSGVPLVMGKCPLGVR